MFNAPVAGEIEHRFLAKPRRIEIAIVHQKFVVLPASLTFGCIFWRGLSKPLAQNREKGHSSPTVERLPES